MNKQKLLISLTAVILTGATLTAVPQIYAETPGSGTHMNFFQELIRFITQKFSLDKTQVQSAITDFRQQQKANITPRPTLSPQQLTDREKTRLDQLVSGGQITADQETAIIGEQATLRTKYNFASLKNLTMAERKTQLDAMRAEVVAWAKSNGIDSSYVMPGFGMGGRVKGMGGFGMGGRGRGWDNDSDENISPTPAP